MQIQIVGNDFFFRCRLVYSEDLKKETVYYDVMLIRHCQMKYRAMIFFLKVIGVMLNDWFSWTKNLKFSLILA